MLDLATEFVHLETEKNSLREKLEESQGELFSYFLVLADVQTIG